MSFDIDISRSREGAPVRFRCDTGPGVVALLGPSGAGKTTILNMIAGIVRPDHGHIRVGGRTLFDSVAGIDLPPAARRPGYVFQDRRLFPHRRVRANLTYGWRDGAGADVDAVVAMLGLGALLDRWPATLSGGEAQRVAIGRALLSAPHFLLMDEPLAAIDAARKADIMQAIEAIVATIGLPILYVTHDEREAARLSSQIFVLDPASV